MHVYILKLKGNKYYVGSTDNLERRMKQHYDGYGSSWTKKYPPIQTINTFENCDKFDEDKHTKRYMSKFGIDNVRGGTYCEINIEGYRTQLEKELEHSADKCFNCGETGHLSNKCKKSRHTKQARETVRPKNVTKPKRKMSGCQRCGRYGHTEESCYAKTNTGGYELDVSEEELEWCCEYCNKGFSTKKGATYHENVYCSKKKKKQKNIKESDEYNLPGLFRAKLQLKGFLKKMW